MPPPPPPPGQQQQQQQQPGGFQQQQQPQYSSATPKFQELGWREIKDRYVRPTYLPASFALGALTIGLRLGAANYTFTDNPFEYLGTAVSTGVMFMALAWVLFDFGEDPPSSGGGGLSGGPRK